MNKFAWRVGLVIGLALVLLLMSFVLYPEGNGTDRIVANGDAYLHTWNLWWVQESVTGFESPYTTDYNGYPRQIDLTFHQLMIPLGVLSIPMFSMGMSAGQVLVFWQYTFVVVGFVGMFLLLEHLFCSLKGTVTAAAYFVLSPMYWQNIPRPDSLSYLVFPWVVLTTLWAKEGSAWKLGVPVILASFVVLMSPYFGASLLLLWVLTLPFSHHLGYSRPRFGALGPLTLLVTSFHWGRQIITERPSLVDLNVIEAFSADLSAWFLPPESLWWIGENMAWWSRSWSATEPSLYVGWFALGVIVVGYKRIPSRVRGWLVGITLCFLLLSIGPSLRIFGQSFFSGWMPYGWGLYLFDSLRAFRAPLRFGYVVLFLGTLALGYVFPAESRWGWLLTGLILLELVRGPVPVNQLPDQSVLNKVANQVDEPAVVGVPVTDWPTEVQYAQTVHEKKLPMVGISYGIEPLWSRVSSNPVLNAFYRRKALPEKGWRTLENKGFGGILFHYVLLGKRHPDLLKRWRSTLKTRYGRPDIKGKRIEYYDFEGSE